MRPTLRPAERLLLELMRPPTPESVPRWTALLDTPGLDWRLFQNPSIGWSMAPLFHHHLKAAGLLTRVPPELAAAMAELARHTALRNRVLEHHLGRLARGFGAAGIPLIALKGADLMLTTYAAPGLRILRDLDLLVPRAHVDAAEAQLRALDFHPAVEMARDWFDAHHHHGVEWRSADGLAHVELHWALARPSDPFALDEAALFERARPLALRGEARRVDAAPLLRLAPLDNLEFLAVHFFRHLTAADWALHSLADMAQLLQREGVALAHDPALPRRAREQGTALPLALAFHLLDDIWPDGALAGPAAALAEAATPSLMTPGLALVAGLFRLAPDPAQPIVSGLMGLGQARGMGGKWRYLTRSLLPAPEALKRDLPAGQRELAGPLRYAAFAGRYAADLGRLGFSAAWAAYRLGRLRGAMERRLPPRRA